VASAPTTWSRKAGAGGKAEAVGADLGSMDGVRKLIESVDTVFGGKFDGRLDILVNNAGTVAYGPFLEQSDESYDKHFNVQRARRSRCARTLANEW
jgi:NAD(P)-dependent dehydrogenase (short-subunit alcohol dehydrogenase family)